MTTSGYKIGLHIGFGGEFYTLWNVEPANTNGLQKAHYWKNISKDLDEAKAKYPNAIVSLSLCGDKWEEREEIEVIDRTDDTEFGFGKYIGESIIECSDEWYLGAYYSWTGNLLCRERLINEFGYSDANGQLLSPKQQEEKRIGDEIVTTFSGEVIVEFLSNVSYQYKTLKAYHPVLDESTEYNYGYPLKLSSDLLNDVNWNSYNGISYGTIGSVRTMKKGEWKLTIDSGVIVAIERYEEPKIEKRGRFIFEFVERFEYEDKYGDYEGEGFKLIVDGQEIQYKGACKLWDVLNQCEKGQLLQFTATIETIKKVNYLKKPTKAKLI